MWHVGAIHNSTFTGVRVLDLLQDMGYDLGKIRGKHLIAEAWDVDVTGKHFEVSIPVDHVLDPLNEVIIAYEQNGKELDLDHGYPLRFVVPGAVGVRNVKWLKRLRISDVEADSVQQKENYKFITTTDKDKINFEALPPLYFYIINSATTYPAESQNIKLSKTNPRVTLRGWATGNQAKGTPVAKV